VTPASLVLASAILSVIALVRRDAPLFRHLDYGDTMGIVIPLVAALRLSVQTIFSSFFFSVLGLRHEPWR
jgi:hypothetical protein